MMRRKDKEIKEIKDIEEILHKATVCRVAMVSNNSPYIVPLNFGYKDRCLYFHSAGEGKKLDILRENTNNTTISRSILDDAKGTDILSTVSSAEFIIKEPVIEPPLPSKITLQIDLQGKISDHTTFKVEIIDPNTGQVVKTFENIESGNNGIAEVNAAGLAQNTYHMKIIVPKYLPLTLRNVVVPDDFIQFTVPMLLAGNLFDLDTIINELDAGEINKKWGSADANADINGDQVVNELDLNFITINWGKKEI